MASGDVSRVRVIELFSKTPMADIDLSDKPPDGPSRGDVYAGESVLRNKVPQFGKGTGAVVGHDHWRAVLESRNLAVVRVRATLPGGTITCRGRAPSNRPQVLRVVEATGVYARAGGICESRAAPRNLYGADSVNVYRLRFSD